MSDGLLSALEDNRDRLLRYLRAQGAGDSAEDLLQDLRLRLLTIPSGPVAAPANYLFRALTNLIIDRRRSETQRARREEQWADAGDRLDERASEPGPDRQLDAQRTLRRIEAALGELPDRARTVLHRHRVDGETQRQIAADLGVSQSTVESDLRQAYTLLHRVRKQLDEE